MAQWRKVIVSGSSAVLNEISASGAIVPKADNGSDLGSSTLEWKDLYIDGTGNIDSLVLTTGATVTGIDNGSLGSSATLLATQGAVKTYVDAQVTAQDFDATTDSGTIDIDLDSETLTIAGGEGIDTSASGTTITITGEEASTSNKGVASFNSDNFSVSSGVVIIKDGGVILGTETTGNYVATAVAGSGIDVSGATGNVTISIGTGEVVNAMIGDNEVNSEHYAAGSIDNEHLADNAVNSDELAADSVDDAHLSDGVATGLAGAGTTATSGVLNVIGGNGITANADDMMVTAAQTTITSIYATDLILGEDSETAIDFGTANEIDFKINNTTELTLDASALYSTVGSGIDLGTSSKEFKDAFFDGTVTSDAFAGPLTGEVTGNASTATALASARTIAMTGDVVWSSGNFDGSGNVTAAATIQANSVEDSMVNDNVATGLAGAGTTATSGVLNVIGGNGITANANDVAITPGQTAITSVYNTALKVGSAASQEYVDFSTSNEVNTKVNDTERLSVTATGVDITGVATISSNLTISGDLTVNGDQTIISTTNLAVEDKFAVFASGSTGATDGGIIVSKQADGAGFALGYDTGTSRWVLDNNLAVAATDIVPDAYVGTVELGTGDGDSQSAPTYGSGVGSIYVDTNDSEIWIYA
jgi:hypothetical protein